MRLRTSSLLVAAAAVLLGACSEDAATHTVFHNLSGAATAVDASTVEVAPMEAGPVGEGGVSSGCGVEPGINRDQFVLFHLTTVIDTATTNAIGDRSYWVRLPPVYDPATPYRVIYLGTGCNGTGKTSYLFNTVDMGQAILVGLNTLEDKAHDPMQVVGVVGKECFDDQVASSIEYPFFDALHKQIEKTFCVDTQREFWAGYSSGSWMANMMGCAFGGVLRAVGGVSGGLPALPTCTGPVAQMFIHDMMDNGNPYSGSVAGRNRVLAINKCVGLDTAPYDPGPDAKIPPGSACVKYTGCPADYPVVFCTTTGQFHMSQDPLATGGFWNFFKMF
jgi:poly(3-hydroxybutyrate) depolymerase